MTQPRQYSLVKVTKTYQNSAPKIITETLILNEDEASEVFLETQDAEDDDLEFTLVEPPSNMDCILTTDGKLSCVPLEDFYGVDSVTVQVVELGLPSYEKPNKVQKKMVVTINEVPDNTERFFVDFNETFYDDKRPKMIHQYRINANSTDSLFAGTIVLADVDMQLFTLLPRFVPLANATYKLGQAKAETSLLSNYTSHIYRSVEAFDVEFEFAPEISGNMTLEFIAQADDGSYTPGVTLEVYVLENPCVHGHCTHPLYGDDACDDNRRATSFDGFVCVCEPGNLYDFHNSYPKTVTIDLRKKGGKSPGSVICMGKKQPRFY